MAATQTFTSFAALAASPLVKAMGGNEVKAAKAEAETLFQSIKEKHGLPAAVIHAFLNDQEACKRYGNAGAILHDAASIAAATGYSEETIFGAVVALVRNGHARLSANGRYIKAA
jgi:hypothetical protein